VADEHGRIDLNNGVIELVEAPFRAAGLRADEAAALARVIEDYALDDGPRGRPFARVSELLEVPGITPALYARVQDGFTVHTGTWAIDPYFAPDVVLDGLGIEHLRDEIVLAEGEPDEVMDREMEALLFGGLGRSEWRYYRVAVEVLLPGGLRLAREAVLDLGPARRGLPRILEWDPSPTAAPDTGSAAPLLN
jgi:hypothetical protein